MNGTSRVVGAINKQWKNESPDKKQSGGRGRRGRNYY